MAGERIKRLLNSKIWYVIILLLTLLRLYLLYDIPIVANGKALHDDELMISMAAWILAWGWLGPYGVFTMPKGAGYPLYLVLVHLSGINYVVFTQILYIAAIILVLTALRKQITHAFGRCLIYVILLFNPVMASRDVMFSIYRNVLVPVLALFIFAGIAGVFFRLKESSIKLLFWSCLTGFGMFYMSITREDSVWIMPFVFVAVAVFVIILIKESASLKMSFFIRLFIMVLPILIFFGGNVLIKRINKHYYGIFATTDTNQTHFADAVKAMYAVEDPEEEDMVSVSRKKLELLYQNSPTLNIFRDFINYSLDIWAVGVGKGAGDNLTDAHFYWALRDGFAMAGIYEDAIVADAYCEKIASELNEAMDSGKLKRISGTMPSALMSPWRKGYLKKLIEAYPEAVVFIVKFDKSKAGMATGNENKEGMIAFFEKFTNCKAIYPGEKSKVPEKQKNKVKFLNIIFKVYGKVNPVIFIVTFLLFIFETVCLIRNSRFRIETWQIWLYLLGILLSAFVLISGVAYTHISAYPAIRTGYLAGVYPLMLLFEGLVLVYVLPGLVTYKNKYGKRALKQD